MISRDFTASWLKKAKADLKKGERRSHHDLVKIHFKSPKTAEPTDKARNRLGVRTEPTGTNNSERPCSKLGALMVGECGVKGEG